MMARKRGIPARWLVLVMASAAFRPAEAQSQLRGDVRAAPLAVPPLAFTYAATTAQVGATQPAAETQPAGTPEPPKSLFGYGYRGVSGFFNVREANANVDRGEWEFEAGFGWSTKSGTRDELGMSQSLKYGITDRFYVELEVMEPRLGDGGDSGAGDLNLTLFYQVLKESELLPAVGAFAQMRIPSGDGSSGVDGKFSAMATKSLTDRFRVHFQGYLTTANGASGAGDEDRRHFQWGLGPGVDFLLDDKTLFLANYLHQVNSEYGERNQNLLEFGVVRQLGHIGQAKHELKLGLDVGLDGDRGTPNLGAKLQWALEW